MKSNAGRSEVLVVPRIAWTTLTCVSLVGFMASIEVTIISLALEDIRAAFANETESLLSWVFNAYNITVAAFLLPAGWIADRYGRQTIFCAGVVIFALGSLLAGLSPSLDFLVAARVLQAVGGALQVPSGMALLLDAFPPQKRQLAIGIWAGTGGLAAALGPTAGALLVDLSGWRAVFLINVPVAVLIIALAPRWVLSDSPNQSLGRVDMLAIPMASIGVGVAAFGIVQVEQYGWISPNTLISFAAALALMIGFVLRSLGHPRPLFDLSLFRLRSFSVGAVGQTAFVLAFFLWFIPLPTFLRAVWGWSVLKAGLAIAPGPLIAVFVAPICGKLADSYGPRRPLLVSAIFGIAGIALQLRFMTVEPNYVTGLLIPTILIGVAGGIAFAATMGAMVAEVKPRDFSMAGAARSTTFQLSLALAVALGFSLIGRPDTPERFLDAMYSTWILVMVFYAVQFLVFFTLYPRQHQLRTG